VEDVGFAASAPALAGAVPAVRRAHPLLRCLAIYTTMPWHFAAAFALFAVVNASVALQQYLVGRAVHDVERGAAVVRSADGSLDGSRAYAWVAILVGLGVVRGGLQYAAGMVSLVTGQELLFRLRDAIFVQVQRLDLGFHLAHGVGEMIARTTRDADKVRDALISFWRNVIETGLVVLSSLAILAWYSPVLALAPALLTCLAVVLFVRLAEHLVALDRAVGDAYDSVSQDLVEGVGGVRVIKAFGLEGTRIAKFNRAVSRFGECAVRALRYSTSRVPLPQAVVALGQVWVFAVGIRLVALGRLNVGELVAALLVMTTLVFRVEGVGRIIQTFADARSSAGRIVELLDAETPIVGGERPVPTGPLGFRFSNVRVRARGAEGDDILRGCSLHVRPGEVVAIVGATGSGKSTLAALLPRLVDPDGGEVRIGSDAAGWVDVRSLHLAALRERVHLGSQECFLFSDTIAANVLLGYGGPSTSAARALIDALRLAEAQDVVRSLPDGVSTHLGDRGVTLSGGQRQRLALARALIARPSILVLDDSTSALDARTEEAILRGIRDLASSSQGAVTMLVIASKPSTVKYADRVAVLHQGIIVAEGTHAELSRTNATYRELLGIGDAAG
jgi:ABC-type multidrug transport system fused ATPase/permease subunit